MELLPSYRDIVEKSEKTEATPTRRIGIRRSPSYYEEIKFLNSRKDVDDFIDFALQRTISYVGIDTEFKFSRPGTVVKGSKTVDDPRSVDPLLLSLALAEGGSDGFRIYPVVIDLSIPNIDEAIQPLMDLPIPFVGHFLKVELFCLWQLSIDEPSQVWDTWVFEKLSHLGENHPKYATDSQSQGLDAIRAKEQSREIERFSCSLMATCQRYGVNHRMASSKTRLQKSFLDHTPGAPFSNEQIEYAAEDAIAAAELYPLQVQQALKIGALNTLVSLEMPWTVTNASMEWTGFHVDADKKLEVKNLVESNMPILERQLSEMGIENARSHKQLVDFFTKAGLIDHFVRDGGVTFDRDQLKLCQHLHPSIPLMRKLKRAGDLISDKIMGDDLVGADGRFHPQYRQLGTDTGRQTSQYPNIMGLDHLLRTLVVPHEGYGIGEADWCQEEVGIAAAIYGDGNLISMFNTGDVYSAMAQKFFQNELSEEEQGLSGPEFKNRYPDHRKKMKVCTLGMIYGITPHGLAKKLGTDVVGALNMKAQFMDMFPDLKEGLRQTAILGQFRGYATALNNVRRYRGKSGELWNWEKNWMANHPVQGSAAVIFKVAGNRLSRLYRSYNANLIIPLHDSFIFEAPLDNLKEVADLTETVMVQVIQEFFPRLRPRVDINIEHPECWNKDGNVHELTEWIDKWAHYTQSLEATCES